MTRRHRRRATAIVLMLALSLSLSGCWDSKDLKNMVVITGQAIDVAGGGYQDRKQDRYTRTALIVLCKEHQQCFDVVPSSGRVLAEATTGTEARTGGTCLFSGVEFVLLSEQLARQGIREPLAAFEMYPQYSYTILWAVSEGKAADFFKVENKAYSDPGAYIKSLIATIPYDTFLPKTNIYDIVTQIDGGGNPVLPLLRRDGDQVDIMGTALFHGERMVDRVGRDDTITMSLLRGAKGKGRIYAAGTLHSERFEMEFVGTCSRKVEVTRDQEGYAFHIKLKLKGEIREHTGTYNFLKDKEFFDEAGRVLCHSVTLRCREMIARMQNEWMFDAFNLGQFAQAAFGDPPEGSKWDEIVPQSKITVEVEAHLSKNGVAF